jgi:holo-[acyl-carrier protein] synthase
MINNIGIDMVQVEALKKMYDLIKKRAFTSAEIDYCEHKPNPYQHLAARFAAKEAFMKAISIGWNKKIQWKQIEVINDSYGKPMIRLSGTALRLFQGTQCKTISVSLSHTEIAAIAIIMIQ